MNYDQLIEKLMSVFASNRFSDDLSEAKREFFELAGAFDEYSTDFELKMSQFVDWYLFTRLLKNKECTPVELAVDLKEFQSTEEERKEFENLAKNVHSLFEFLKVKNEDVYIRDLFSKEKYIIAKSPVTAGFDREVFFESRLIPSEQGFRFGKSFCFHASEVSKFILKEIKIVQKIKDPNQRNNAKQNLIHRLFKMKYKHEKYKHVNIKEIYSNDSKLRI